MTKPMKFIYLLAFLIFGYGVHIALVEPDPAALLQRAELSIRNRSGALQDIALSQTRSLRRLLSEQAITSMVGKLVRSLPPSS